MSHPPINTRQTAVRRGRTEGFFECGSIPWVMEYVQGRITTLHDLADPVPAAPVDRAAVVVPMTGREHASLAASRTLSALERVDPARVVVALRAPPDEVAAVQTWLNGHDLSVETIWCDAPALEERLGAAGMDGDGGKGRDVWLALGIAAADHEFVVVHDADATSYSPRLVPRLLFALDRDYQFAKGYYARVEEGRMYGRLFRLLYAPLVRALADDTPAPILAYLGAFRYALAGEFAATAGLVRRLRPSRGWGLEVSTLGDAFDVAGFEATAQVDLGVHQHDHRSVAGPGGLADMAAEVTASLFAVLEDHGITPEYDTLQRRYRDEAEAFVRRYAADAAFNGLDYDPAAEREQVAAYADAVRPGPDPRLPAWRDTSLDPAGVRETARTALEAHSQS